MARKPTTASLSFEIPFEERISRLFVFRCLWLVVEVWVFYVWGIVIAVIYILHFFHMLFLGKRNRVLWDMEMRYMRHTLKWQSYFSALSSGRPKWIED